MTWTKNVNGQDVELTPGRSAAKDAEVTEVAAGAPERARLAANEIILAQLAEIELQGIRSIRELERHRSHPGDISDTVRDRAMARNRELDQQATILRGQLIPAP